MAWAAVGLVTKMKNNNSSVFAVVGWKPSTTATAASAKPAPSVSACEAVWARE